MDETSNVPTKVRAQRSDRWQLLAFWEGGNLSFELRGEASLILGRGDDCDVAVPHESVSRRHARLTGDSGVWRIEDLGSSNGTFVAGARIGKGEARDVSPGTVVMLGDARVLLDAPTLGPSTATPARRAVALSPAR
jgi:two-component system response regulator AtoC